MSNAVATIPLTQEQFQEAMMARMRGIMGELMPQATLEEITKRGVEEAFFKPRLARKGNGYGSKDEFDPPWVNEFVQKEIADEVKKQIAAWIVANQDRLTKLVETSLSDGVTGCVMQAFAEMFRTPLMHLAVQINDRFQKLGQGSVYVS